MDILDKALTISYKAVARLRMEMKNVKFYAVIK